MSDAEIKKLTYDEIIELKNEWHQKTINRELERIAEEVAKKIRQFIYGTECWGPYIKVGLNPLPLTMIEEYLSTQFTIQFKVEYLGNTDKTRNLFVLLCGGDERA